MCCLFGIHDYGHRLSVRQRAAILTALATASEARGTDATGIAYNTGGKLCIFKRPLPGHLMWFRVPREATVISGHTRASTQGSEKRNRNNHPFPGKVGDAVFALAHNGVLYNDQTLRQNKKLPATNVETDSYIAVQLLEAAGELSFNGLRKMAEPLKGSSPSRYYLPRMICTSSKVIIPCASTIIPIWGCTCMPARRRS
jgi:glutamine phosphoribosylpyrophosphate amidotransferase